MVVYFTRQNQTKCCSINYFSKNSSSFADMLLLHYSNEAVYIIVLTYTLQLSELNIKKPIFPIFYCILFILMSKTLPKALLKHNKNDLNKNC